MSTLANIGIFDYVTPPGCSGQPAWQNKNRVRGNFNFEGFTARLEDFIPASANNPLASNLAIFGNLALELFTLQFEHNLVYRNFCDQRGASPESVRHWTRIPSVPTVAFKEHDLSCLRGGERTCVFYSSGTTEHRPSRHFHNRSSLRIYESSVLNWFFANILHDGFGRSTSNRHDSPRLLILTPPATDAPHSSLVHMFDTLRRAMEQPSNVFYGTLASDGGWQIDFPAVVQSLTKIKSENNPCFLLGTAFSFVHLLEYLEQHPFCLPAGSRVLETGGYKGRSRSLEKHELHSWIQKNLGVEQANIIGEYGMSELSSQAYDLVENNKSKSTALPMRVFHFPPWAQVQIISPETGDEVGEGETGLVRVFDLANTYSVMAIQTEDLAIRRGNGFELLGRAAAAEARGCSLMAT